jgi:hypothetical protein
MHAVPQLRNSSKLLANLARHLIRASVKTVDSGSFRRQEKPKNPSPAIRKDLAPRRCAPRVDRRD